MDHARLETVPFFKGLKKKELALIAQQADELDVKPGTVLAREGEFGHEFFIIESGTATVTKGGESVVALGRGDFFGELALLEEERRTATVTANTPMTVIVMSRSSFRTIERSMPQVHATISKAIEERRRRTEEPTPQG